MNKPVAAPSFAVLLQRFFTEHLQQHRAVVARGCYGGAMGCD
jgi:hypothetical protein